MKKKHSFLLLILLVLFLVLGLFFVGIKEKLRIPARLVKFCTSVEPVTECELAYGWYWGSLNCKRVGTPDNWYFTLMGTRSAGWYGPVSGQDPEEVCFQEPEEETYYEIEPISECELIRGWYYWEDSNSKKPGTPEDWVHANEGTRSAMWSDPSPEDPTFDCSTQEE